LCLGKKERGERSLTWGTSVGERCRARANAGGAGAQTFRWVGGCLGGFGVGVFFGVVGGGFLLECVGVGFGWGVGGGLGGGGVVHFGYKQGRSYGAE